MKKVIYIVNIALGLLILSLPFLRDDDKSLGISFILFLALMVIDFLCGMIFMLGNKRYHIPFYNSIGILLFFIFALFVISAAQ